MAHLDIDILWPSLTVRSTKGGIYWEDFHIPMDQELKPRVRKTTIAAIVSVGLEY